MFDIASSGSVGGAVLSGVSAGGSHASKHVAAQVPLVLGDD